MVEINEVGAFQNTSELIIHAYQTKNLLEGSKRTQTEKRAYPIIGLYDYGRQLIKIWNAIKADDPYAEMALIEIERRINNAFTILENLHQETDELLKEQLPGITVNISESKKTSTLSIDDKIFSTVHAVMGVRLLGLHDLLIRKLNTAVIFRKISRTSAAEKEKQAGQLIRGVFIASVLYKKLHVNREDIRQKTPKGQEAIDKLGMIPLAILEREEKTEYGPSPVTEKIH